MYNDSLPIALAINSYLQDSGPFAMRVIGLEFTASTLVPPSADEVEAKALLKALIEQAPTTAERVSGCAEWQVHISGLVDGVYFNHTAPMLRAKSQDGVPRINASWESAFRTLQAATRR